MLTYGFGCCLARRNHALRGLIRHGVIKIEPRGYPTFSRGVVKHRAEGLSSIEQSRGVMKHGAEELSNMEQRGIKHGVEGLPNLEQGVIKLEAEGYQA